MEAVEIGRIALELAGNWDEPPPIEIFFDQKPVIEGKATAFTNGAIEAAIIHSRALLEFLGIGIDRYGELTDKSTRRPNDHAIEDFGRLPRLTVNDALRAYTGPAAEAKSALTHVIYLANKGLAHTTSDFNASTEAYQHLNIAFNGVPVLIIRHLFMPLGMPTPSFAIQSRNLI